MYFSFRSVVSILAAALTMSVAAPTVLADGHIDATTLVAAAQGWSPSEWQKIADGIAKQVHWTSPTISGANGPAPSSGWALAG